MPRPVHFELPADDPQRAAKFYQTVFGWTAQKWDGPMEYWMVKTGEDSDTGINGGIVPRQGSGGTVNTIDVPDVDRYAASITAAGGELVMPKTAIPGVGYLAYFKDTEGNSFGIMQADESAA